LGSIEGVRLKKYPVGIGWILSRIDRVRLKQCSVGIGWIYRIRVEIEKIYYSIKLRFQILYT
jgi:hypothetical protein